ncbi:ABC transporter domain-containing protein [Rhizoctonia solani AG-1 IA]|uniref:ABC transporter domain-containing protein n=1 Tax=Thanatephorus cucumeris (strain AG1-IA) TaxID=983506 RepID=L8WUU2_THACA|nr:ABC transporter domain-containing protein [Rhizoctonia solani AG-1 IA]
MTYLAWLAINTPCGYAGLPMIGMSGQEENKTTVAIDIKDLTYKHASPFDGIPPALVDLSLSLPKGSRTLLIGANGAGKSTLLQILAGKRLVKSNDVRIFGRDVFRNSPPGITYLGTEWAMNPVVRSDIVVSHFLDSIGGYSFSDTKPAGIDCWTYWMWILIGWSKLLWISPGPDAFLHPERHMHAISDGERRRVQLVMGLMGEWDVLLLDEESIF